MATAVYSSNNGRHTRLQELLSVGVDDEIVNDVLQKIKERRHRARQMASRRLGSKTTSIEELPRRSDVHTEHAIEIVEAKEKTLPQVIVESQAPSSFPGSETTPPSQFPAKSNTATTAASNVSAVNSKLEQTDSPSESHRPAQSSIYRMRRFLRPAEPKRKAFIRHWQARRKDPTLRSKTTDPEAPDPKDSQSAQINDHCETSAPTIQIDVHRDTSAPSTQIDVHRNTSAPTGAAFESSYSEDTIVAEKHPEQSLMNGHKDAEDDASVSNETQGSDQSEQTRVPKHLRGLFSSNVLASKPKGNPTAEPQPFLQKEEMVSELLENYMCGACAAVPFDEEEVDFDDAKAPAAIEGPDHGVKHFLEARAEQFREQELNVRANDPINVKAGVETLEHQQLPQLRPEVCAKTSLPTEGQISPERETQKTDGDTLVNADSLSSPNSQDLEHSKPVVMTQVSAVVSIDCEGLSDQGILVEWPMNTTSAMQSSPVHLEEISNLASAGVRSSVDSTGLAESATAVEKEEGAIRTDSVEYQTTAVKNVTTATARNPVTLIPTVSLCKVREDQPQRALAKVREEDQPQRAPAKVREELPQPAPVKVLPSQLTERLDTTHRQQANDETVISASSPLRTPSHVNDTFYQSTDSSGLQLSPTSVRATNFWRDAGNQSIECCIAFGPSELNTVGADKDSVEIACKEESIETFPCRRNGSSSDVEVLVFMSADCSTSANEEFPSPRIDLTLAADGSPPAIPQEVFMPVELSKSISDGCKDLDFDLPPRTSMPAFADFFNLKAISSSPSKVEPSNLACCFTSPQEGEDETSEHPLERSFNLFDDDGPSVDDDGPSLNGGVPSLDGDIPTIDDNGPSFEDGAPSFEDGQSDDGLSLDDGQHFQNDWADSMNDSVDRVVEALDATASGFFPSTADMGNTWLAKSVLTGFGTSKHGSVDDVLEDVCEKLDDIEVTMFISSFWNTKSDTNADYDADYDADFETDLEMDANLESQGEKGLAFVASF